jgi:hypothetical protein
VPAIVISSNSVRCRPAGVSDTGPGIKLRDMQRSLHICIKLHKRRQDTMFNDDIYTRHHRGSSPSFEEPARRLEDWMRSCRSLDQHPYSLSEIQLLRQCTVPKIEFLDRGPETQYLNNEEYLDNEI